MNFKSFVLQQNSVALPYKNIFPGRDRAADEIWQIQLIDPLKGIYIIIRSGIPGTCLRIVCNCNILKNNL